MSRSEPLPDREWFMQQVRQEQAGLRAFVRMLGLRAEVVDDVAQEAFLIAYQKLTTFQRDTNFGAWLRTIARNLVHAELRREDRRKRLMAEHVTSILAERSTRTTSLNEERVVQVQLAQQAALQDCLRELPQRSRQLVQQRYFEGLSPAIIASFQDTNSNAVSQMLFRLREALRTCINRRLALGEES